MNTELNKVFPQLYDQEENAILGKHFKIKFKQLLATLANTL